MRIVRILTYCILNAALMAYSESSVAAQKVSLKSSASKTLGHRSKKIAKVQKKPVVDIWERVRAGMQIPRPVPPEPVQTALPGMDREQLDAQPKKNALGETDYERFKRIEALNQKLTDPSIESKDAELMLDSDASDPELDHLKSKYTELGWKKLHPKKVTNISSVCSQNADPKKDDRANGITKRVHTSITFSSGLQDHSLTAQRVDSKADDASLHVLSVKPYFNSRKTKIDCPQIAKADLSKLNSAGNAETKLADNRLTANVQKSALGQAVASIAPSPDSPYDRVQRFVQQYSQQPGYIRLVAERSRPYLFHIVESLNQYKLPYELALLPIVESAYQPTAFSSKSAAGLWQFIPSTGAEYNLRQTEFIDERLDIAASTQAAMRFLSFLRQYYNGDWLLAIAAYNCGPGRIDQAIQQNRSNGLSTDFWSLQLPVETQEYVPRLLALATIFANPGAYNIKLNRINNEPYFVRLKINRDIDVKNLAYKELTSVAQLANLSLEQFKQYNPAYISTKLSAADAYNFILPGANASQLQQRLDMLANIVNKTEPANSTFSIKSEPYKQPSWQSDIPYLTLNVNDTQSILKQDNKPQTDSQLNQGNKPMAEAKAEELKIHVVAQGETLISVAKRYLVSVEEIRTANKLALNQDPTPGQQLLIPLKRKKLV